MGRCRDKPAQMNAGSVLRFFEKHSKSNLVRLGILMIVVSGFAACSASTSDAEGTTEDLSPLNDPYSRLPYKTNCELQ